MKQWLAEHILTTNDLMMEETMTMSNSEFAISIGLVAGALAIFSIFIHVFGA